MKHKYSTYALLGILIALQCVVNYYGWSAMFDAFSVFWLEGMTVEQANCIAEHGALLEGLSLE